ncbi:hypothetical protein MAR_020831 [Mya arenaria]|uniref:Secreted protein n=1 Tax=Mya arenaria TaxID=6604 RepID=A0ABY7E927_MYAAR|nr:hypothetical protein MAR_020831 [Mya arenaria]
MLPSVKLLLRAATSTHPNISPQRRLMVMSGTTLWLAVRVFIRQENTSRGGGWTYFKTTISPVSLYITDWTAAVVHGQGTLH